MNVLENKIAFVEQLLLVARENPYSPERCADWAFKSALDYQAYRYGDLKLDEIIDLMQGMSAGEEFYYSQSELVQMLESYLHELKV
ncbi:hypothetical protein [Pseudomonas sichuanensis]|uniref:hypothetical protein n=1 Tax=Pseudomonas sichuanensis TaxID=2213015 RepID=UPI0021605177|nr:hypothetical protein [Pseudomonas sichuanensis]UVL91386.1 hypothetical protein LOY51_11110 [Pseudomonas sichuanensis]